MIIEVYINQAKNLLTTLVSFYIMFPKYAKYFHTSIPSFILFPLISIFPSFFQLVILHHSRTSTNIACSVKSFLKFFVEQIASTCVSSTLVYSTKHLIL